MTETLLGVLKTTESELKSRVVSGGISLDSMSLKRNDASV